MALDIIIEPLVELVAEFFGQALGVSAWDRLQRHWKPYSNAYCESFYCARCPGMAKGKRVKMKWFLYRRRDCGGRWGVLREQPWVRRERRMRPATL